MDKFLINSTLVYRVPTVEDALKLRDILSETPYGELTNFSYTTKYIKAKGEVIEEYQVVKAKIELITFISKSKVLSRYLIVTVCFPGSIKGNSVSVIME